MKRHKVKTAGSLRTSKSNLGADVLSVAATALAAAVFFGVLTPEQSAEAFAHTGELVTLTQNAFAGILALVAGAGQLFRYLRLAIEEGTL